MSIKDELLVIVRAFVALIHNPADAEALAAAQTQIADLKAAQTLTEAEQAEVDEALAAAAAVTPPTPQEVEEATDMLPDDSGDSEVVDS